MTPPSHAGEVSSEGDNENGAAFVDAAVREGMLVASQATEVMKQVRKLGKPAAVYLVESGRLTPIQAEAIGGLVRPDSVAPGYQVVGLLGHGGIGVVYRARQPSLDREVALKTISAARVRESSSAGSVAMARFQQEAKAIAKLQHPSIVAAYDYGAGEDRMYLAMEMVPGVDLESFIKRHDRVDEPTAWRLVRQAAAALAHAHGAGIIHRDIKPANLLLTDPPAGYPLPAGVPLLKVTDFGLARLQPGPAGEVETRDEATRLTVMGATMGTPHYMAPEQIDSAEVDHRADIYALGATAYHMIAGEPPLAGLSLMKIFAAKLSGEGATVEDLPPDVSDGARGLLHEMLRNEPSERPADYQTLIERIDRLLGDESALAAKPVTLSTTLAAPTPLDMGASSTVELRTASRRRTLGLRLVQAFAALVVLGGLGAVGWLLPSSGPPTPGYTVSNRLAVERQLYTGSLGPPWNKISRGEGDFAGMLKVTRVAGRDIRSEREALADPEHFRLFFQQALGKGADAIEIVLATLDESEDELVLRIEPSTVTFGVHRRQGDAFEPLHEPATKLPIEQGVFPAFQLDRDARHWIVYQYEPDRAEPRRLAWTKLRSPAPDVFRFRAVGGDAYLGEPTLIELLPVEGP